MINPDLMSKPFVTTPLEIDADVRVFCKEIALGQQPSFIELRPTETAKYGECYHNVQEHIGTHGGSVVFGWAIWQWRYVFLEAEHHAVWQSHNGSLLDITPNDHWVSRILFLPDPLHPYNYLSEEIIENRHKNLSGIREVDEFLGLGLKKKLILRKNASNGYVQLAGDDLTDFENIDLRSAILRSQILNKIGKKIGRNDKCLCSSGKKFKACCAPLF